MAEDKWNQYLDAYSDDLAYLHQARAMVVEKSTTPHLAHSAFCRLLLMNTIGAIELMLLVWSKKPGAPNFDPYFKRGDDGAKKAGILVNLLSKNKPQTEPEIIREFVALKTLRNSIVHVKTRDGQKALITKYSYPSDPMELGEEHWDRIWSVYQKMMFYIAISTPGSLK